MKILLIPGIFAGIIIAAAIGLFEAPDSIQYIYLGQYLNSGQLVPTGPFNYTYPPTLFGPVYGLLMTPLTKLPWPWGITLIPLLQFLFIIVSAILLHTIFIMFFSKRVSALGTLLFVFFPFEIVYGTYLLSEILTQLLFAIYLYTLVHIQKSRWATPDTLVGIAAALTLTRYVFIVLLGYSIGYWILSSYRKKNPRSPARLFCFIGMGLVGIWMLFNWNFFGTLQLTSHTGRHLYNNVVTLGKLLPRSIPDGTEVFFERVPPSNVFLPWWVNQLHFPDMKETVVDRMFLRLSLSAIASHPLLWAKTVAYASMSTPLSSPYQLAPYRSGQIHDVLATCTGEIRMPWNSNLKSTPIQNCAVNRIWNMFLAWQQAFYPVGAAVCFVLALIGLGAALFSQGIRRQFAVIFLLLHGAASATEWIEGRFLIPLYPLYIFFIITGAVVLFRRRSTHHTRVISQTA